MGTKSEVVVVDVLMKNESKHSDIFDIMSQMHEYLGQNYPSDHRILSGGDGKWVPNVTQLMETLYVNALGFLNQSQKTGTAWFACSRYVLHCEIEHA